MAKVKKGNSLSQKNFLPVEFAPPSPRPPYQLKLLYTIKIKIKKNNILISKKKQKTL